MTVTAQSPRYVAYGGDAGSGPFPLPFRFLDAAEVKAAVVALDGTREPLEGLDVQGAGDPEGGAATAPRAILAGETLLLWTETALIQPADYIAADAFPAETHEAALDRLTLIAQDQRRDLARALSTLPGDDIGALPDVERRKGMLLTFDSETGDPVTERDYAGFVTEVARQFDVVDAAFTAVAAEGAAQLALVGAAGAAQVTAIGIAGADIAAVGESQIAAIEAAGEANTGAYFTNDAAGLAAAGPDAYFGVEQSYGKGVDWKVDSGGAASFRGYGAGPLGAEVRQIRLHQLSSLLCTQVPPGWDVWWAMDAELTDRAYIPYRGLGPAFGATRCLLNTFGAGELRTDGSTGNPIANRFDVDGPLGPASAASLTFGATSQVWTIVGSDTLDLADGQNVKIEITAVTAEGSGSKNYRIGMSGTADIHYKQISIADEVATDFSDSNNSVIVHNFTFAVDRSKIIGLWPDTNGDAATVRVGSIRLISADSEYMPLNAQVWGGYVCRGTSTPGGVVLDNGYCFTTAGLTDGLIDFHASFPAVVDYSSGKTEVVLGEFVGGSGSGTYGIMSSEDYDTGVVPAVGYTTFAIAFENSGAEGQYAPQPSYNFSRHGASGKGMGLQPWWNRIGPHSHDYGVDGAILYERAPTFNPWSSRAERCGSYNGTRDITHSGFRNNMRIAAKARRPGVASNGELAQVIRALKEQYLITGASLGPLAEFVGLIGDSNDTRAANEWTYRITAANYMGPDQPNLFMRSEAVGGKGLYTSTGGIAAFNVDSATGFIHMLERLFPAIELAQELGLPVGILLRGFTNDYQHIALDTARVVAEYEQHLWAPIRASGADLLLVSPLPSATRFPGDLLRAPLIAAQAAYAAANDRVWHIAPSTGAWSLAEQATYYQGDFVHLETTAGDIDVAGQIKAGVLIWRGER